ncbi:hypothetical protein COO60DRAFT_1516760, partial [Scenedesmus sp. NREL 46B-D3]
VLTMLRHVAAVKASQVVPWLACARAAPSLAGDGPAGCTGSVAATLRQMVVRLVKFLAGSLLFLRAALQRHDSSTLPSPQLAACIAFCTGLAGAWAWPMCPAVLAFLPGALCAGSDRADRETRCGMMLISCHDSVNVT